jgi:hypothetical protein
MFYEQGMDMHLPHTQPSAEPGPDGEAASAAEAARQARRERRLVALEERLDEDGETRDQRLKAEQAARDKVRRHNQKPASFCRT